MQIYVEAIGLASTALLTSAWLPQLAKTLKTKRAEDISYGYLLMLLAGFFGWLTYGLLLNLLAVIVSNSLNIILVLTQIALKVVYDGAPHITQGHS